MTPTLLAAAALVPLYLAVEAVRHHCRLRRIPIRIHVNGTRGKTTVTRRLAAALRAAGIRTVAKVTGDAPLLIGPDGTETPVPRRGPARIQEQMWLVRQAARWHAGAIVVECMALAPDLQRVSEERMLRSTAGVITNVRPDHLEVMGGDLDAVAAALAGTIPRQGVLVTADRHYFASFAAQAAARGTQALLAETGGPAYPAAPDDEHAAIVRAVCTALHLPTPAASPARDRPAVWRLELGSRRLFVVDAFSANDPVSTELLQQDAARQVRLPEPRIALVNNRADRPARMLLFADHLRSHPAYAAIALGGELAGLARRRLRDSDREVWPLGAATPERIIAEIARRIAAPEWTIVGMGNAKGLGLEFIRFLREKGRPCH